MTQPNTPYRDLLPPLSTAEREALRDDIIANGQLVPIMLMATPDGDVVIDGHHRLAICLELGLVPLTSYVDDDWPEALAMRMNVNRRNLSADQRKELREAQKKLAEQMAAAGVKAEDIGALVGVARKTVNDWLVTSYGESATTSTDDRPAARSGPKPKDDDEPATSVRIPKSEYSVIYQRHKNGESQTAIAADYKCAQQRISQICDSERKREELEAKNAELAANPPPPLKGKYDVIVIDPPWQMQKIDREVAPNQVAFDYPTMTEQELADLELPAADDCHVWVWTTHKQLPTAIRLLDSWGLKYVCTFVWHKPGGFQPFGLPQYNCEFAVYARKGSPKFSETKAFPTCFNAPRGAHSEKPEDFYDIVRRVTAGRRIDIFNRRAIDGFDTWGNEAAA